MFKSRSRRRGFTLPEVLVTVAIVAVLAAAVVPTVINQMSKGDSANVIADLTSFASGVTGFVTDTRKYPGLIVDLNEKPDATDEDIFDVDYGTAAVNRWRGPYVATTQSLTTGYNAAALNITIEDSLSAPTALNGRHISLRLKHTTAGGGVFTQAQIQAIDQLLDGGDGVVATDCTTPTTNSTSGKLTWTETAACVVSAVRYRLVPVGQ